MSGRLVYLIEDLNEHSVTPSRLAEVIEDLEDDAILVQVLDPITLEPVGEEFETDLPHYRDIVDARGHMATKETWVRE